MILLFLILLAGMELKIFRSLFTICQSELILVFMHLRLLY